MSRMDQPTCDRVLRVLRVAHGDAVSPREWMPALGVLGVEPDVALTVARSEAAYSTPPTVAEFVARCKRYSDAVAGAGSIDDVRATLAARRS